VALCSAGQSIHFVLNYYIIFSAILGRNERSFINNNKTEKARLLKKVQRTEKSK